MQDIVLSAKRSTWRMHDHAGEADAEFSQARLRTLELADKRCTFCELRADKWQEVHHLDDDHGNNGQSNLACACPLCHQVFHLGLAGLHDGGDLIYAPEFSQVELNSLVLACWLAVASGGEYSPGAVQVYEDLKNRNFYVTSIVREWAREAGVKIQEPFKFTPDMLANALIRLDDDDYGQRAQMLGGLRLLPKDARFKQQISHWVSYFGRSLPTAQWPTLVRDLSSIIRDVR